MDRMTGILFSPFRWKTWLKLIFIALIAGALSANSGGGSGGGPGRQDAKESSVQSTDNDIQSEAIEATPGVKGGNPVDASTRESSEKNTQTDFPGEFFSRWWMAIAVVVIPFVVLFMWLSSRFKFVWIQAILTKEARVRGPFGAYKKQGNSLFLFSLLFTAAMLTVGGALVKVLWKPFMESVSAEGSGFRDAMGLFMGPALLIAVFIVAAMILWTYIDDFVLPIMMADKAGFRESTGRFAKVFCANKKDMLLYLVFKFLLGVAGAIVMFIVLIAVMIAFGLAALCIFGFLYVIFAVLLKIQVLFMVLAVLIGVPFVIAFFIAVLMGQLPIAVFFRSFSLYYLTSLRSGYEPLSLD